MEVRRWVLPSFRRSLSRVVKKNIYIGIKKYIVKKLCKLTLCKLFDFFFSGSIKQGRVIINTFADFRFAKLSVPSEKDLNAA